MLEFEKKVIEIADYICAYGLNHSGVNLNPPRTFADLTEEENNLFMKTCHIGFKKGQDMILENLLEIQEKLSLQKINLKTANRNNDKELSMTIQKELDLLKHKSNILRHLADAIAWNLIKHQLYIARKLHTGEQDDKTLNNSNLQSVIKVVDKVNENPMSFALISDITSYIQIGDVLCNDNGILSIIEVKEGDKNREIGEIVDTMFKNDIDINEINKDNNLDKNEEKHIKRYYNQMVKMNRLSDILNKDEGLDPKTGTQVKILTPQISTEDYLELLHNMHLELEEKTWSYNIIENCLHIGMYRGENRFNNGLLLQILAKEQGENFVIYDFVSIIHQIQKPLFFRPFKKDFIFDILFNRVKIYFALSLDTLIEFYNYYGVKAEWASEKATMQLKQQQKNMNIFELNKRGIIITPPNGEQIWLGKGTIAKIIYEHYLPSYMIYCNTINTV